MMITAGIDCGAKNTHTVILKNGEIIGKAVAATGLDPAAAAGLSLDRAIEAAGISRDDIHRICVTGSGRNAIPMANKTIHDVQAMGRGAFFHFPGARTVLDVGAEESRAARLDQVGRVVDFAVNERCAAGAGVFIEAMGRALETPLEAMGPLALTTEAKIAMNAQCVIFAESEVVGLIHAKTPKNAISRAIHDSMAGRIVSMVRRIGVQQDVVMIGGVAYNPGIVVALQRQLNLKRLLIAAEPAYGSAAGAAIAAAA
jgi:benzoyl-CoA reductase subunit D